MAEDTGAVHLGVADHLGWAIVVAVSTGLEVVDRRRIELVAPELTAAPVHHLGGAWELHTTGEPLSDDELAARVAEVRASAAATIDRELAHLADEVAGTVVSLSLRTWPPDFPTDIATQRRVPHESRADPVMYRQELAAAANRRGWTVATYDARNIERLAGAVLGDSDDDPLARPRRTLGSPWSKDHRSAFAAAVVAAAGLGDGRSSDH